MIASLLTIALAAAGSDLADYQACRAGAFETCQALAVELLEPDDAPPEDVVRAKTLLVHACEEGWEPSCLTLSEDPRVRVMTLDWDPLYLACELGGDTACGRVASRISDVAAGLQQAEALCDAGSAWMCDYRENSGLVGGLVLSLRAVPYSGVLLPNRDGRITLFHDQGAVRIDPAASEPVVATASMAPPQDVPLVWEAQSRGYSLPRIAQSYLPQITTRALSEEGEPVGLVRWAEGDRWGLWTAQRDTLQPLPDWPTGECASVAVGSDGLLRVTAPDCRRGPWSAQLLGWDGEPRGSSWPMDWRPSSYSGLPQGTLLAEGPESLLELDPMTGEFRTERSTNEHLHVIVDGLFLTTEGPDAEVVVWDPQTLEPQLHVELPGLVRSAARSPDGALLAISTIDPARLHLLDRVSGEPVHPPMAIPVDEVAFTAEGVLVASSRHSTALFDLDSSTLGTLQRDPVPDWKDVDPEWVHERVKEFVPHHRIEGRVTSGEHSAVGAQVGLTQKDGRFLSLATIDADGTYALTLPRAVWRLAARSGPDAEVSVGEEIRLERDERRDLSLPDPSPAAQMVLAGVIRSSGTGEPMPGAIVSVGDRQAVSDTTGRYELPVPWSSELRRASVHATLSDEPWSGVAELPREPGEHELDLVVRDQPEPGEFHIQVVDAAGRGVPGVEVMGVLSDSRGWAFAGGLDRPRKQPPTVRLPDGSKVEASIVLREDVATLTITETPVTVQRPEHLDGRLYAVFVQPRTLNGAILDNDAATVWLQPGEWELWTFTEDVFGMELVTIEPGQPSTVIPSGHRPTLDLVIDVIDDSGLPVPHAHVSLWPIHERIARNVPSRLQLRKTERGTDLAGRVAFEGVWPERTVRVKAHGFEPVEVAVDGGPGPVQIVLTAQ